MTQTFWLSFCDANRPAGEQFLGAVVVDVDERDVARAEGVTSALRAFHGLPPLTDTRDQYLAAAIWKTHRLECNPGGEVAAMRLDEWPQWSTVSACYPRGRVLSRTDIAEVDRQVALAVDPPSTHD